MTTMQVDIDIYSLETETDIGKSRDPGEDAAVDELFSDRLEEV